MPRSLLGRGLNNVEDKAERILLQFHTFLANRKSVCQRKKCIIYNEKTKATQLGLINEYILSKYSVNKLNVKDLEKLQQKNLTARISAKSLHLTVIKHLKMKTWISNQEVCGLELGIILPAVKPYIAYCKIEIYSSANQMLCNHCNAKIKSVDHLATKCGRLLYINYTQRHDEVLRCLHLHYVIHYAKA